MKAILVDDEPDGIRTLQKDAGAALPASKNSGNLFQRRHRQNKQIAENRPGR